MRGEVEPALSESEVLLLGYVEYAEAIPADVRDLEGV